MALDKTQNASPIDATAAGAVTAGMAVLGVPAEQVAKVTAATQAVSNDPGTWFRNLGNTIMQALGAKEGIKTVEPSKGGEVSTTQKTALEGVPERQAMATDTAAKAAGPIGIQTALLPILAFIGAGAMFFLKGGGVQQFLGMLDSATNVLGPVGGFGGFGASIMSALNASVTAQGKTLDDLKTDAGLAALLPVATVAPTPGVNTQVLPLGDYLAHASSLTQVVGVPSRPAAPGPTAKTEVSETSTEVQPGIFAQTREQTDTRPSSPPASTDLVPANLATPPKVDLVSTAGFAYDPNPFKTFGNPAAALENEIALAQDLNAIAGQQDAVAEAATNINAAADKFLKGEYDQSLALSLRALIKGLSTYNLQSDVTLNPTLVTNRSLRWWDQFLPPPRVLDPVITDKIANGQTLSPAEVTAYNTAMSQLTTMTVNAVATDRRFAVLPGTLVWSALRNDPFTGTLDALVNEIPERIALKEGLSGSISALIHDIIYDDTRPDADVLTIPDLLQGADPRIQQYQSAIQRWIQTVQTYDTATAAELAVLISYIPEVGSGPLTFVQLCRDLSLNLDTLYSDLLHDRLLLDQQLELNEIVVYWDQLVLVLDPEAPTDPGAQDFLREIMAAKELLGVDTLEYALEQFDEGVLVVGNVLGQDMVYATGALGALLRAETILTGPMAEAVKTSRTKALLGYGDEMSTNVQYFPNPGILGRISEVL